MLVSKPAKELSILLQTKVMLERANTENIMRHDGIIFKQLNLIANSKNMFLLNSGPAVAYDKFDFSLTQDQAFKSLSEAIQSHADRIKFNMLMLPVNAAGIEHCLCDVSGNVVIRAIEYYEIRIDEILTRYDILVEKVIKNA